MLHNNRLMACKGICMNDLSQSASNDNCGKAVSTNSSLMTLRPMWVVSKSYAFS